jgi:hypothetical protein
MKMRLFICFASLPGFPGRGRVNNLITQRNTEETQSYTEIFSIHLILFLGGLVNFKPYFLKNTLAYVSAPQKKPYFPSKPRSSGTKGLVFFTSCLVDKTFSALLQY